MKSSSIALRPRGAEDERPTDCLQHTLSMLHIAMASRSGVGARPHNEDDLRYGANRTRAYAVLSDGAGGHRDGAVASDLVVRMIALKLQGAHSVYPSDMSAMICDAHIALGEQQQGHHSADRMHATVVALWVDVSAATALWSHVGDSRLYMLRGGRVCRVTRDDSVVQQMVEAGYLSPQEARDHPSKSQLVSAMGVDGDVEPHTLPQPETIRDGDAFLLCSDGWWECADRGCIESTFARATSVDEWLEGMATTIRGADQAGQDNYSAIGVWIGNPAEATLFNDLD